jgi:hypothetical protein
MTQVQRRLAKNGDERSSLLEHHIAGAGDEVVRSRERERGQRAHAARADDHARRHEATARDRRADVAMPVDDVGERLHLGDGVVGLVEQRAPAGRADHEMRFDVVALSQQLEQADAVDRARGARDADDEAIHVHG